MAIISPVSQSAYGVIPTISALRAVSVVNVSDGNVVQVLGSGSATDGLAGTYSWSGACGYSDNGFTVVKSSTTGAWIRVAVDSPIYATTVQTASYSGIGENLVLLSGGATLLKYCLPPSYVMFGEPILVKNLGTGQINVQATGADSIFPLNSTVAVTNFTAQTSGTAYNLLPSNGVWYQV